MVAGPHKSKERLIRATARLAATGGLHGLTVQAIAREVGFTDGAMYRHYRSKEELLWAAYEWYLSEMILEKKRLAAEDRFIDEKLREWVRLTYAYFDRDPEAFSFVLLTPHPQPTLEEHYELLTAQGRQFTAMIECAQAAGEVRPMPTGVALSHFSGLMLNVPRLIREGQLDKPAVQYVDEVWRAVWRVFSPE